MNELDRLIEDYVARGFTPAQAEWCARNDLDNGHAVDIDRPIEPYPGSGDVF